MASTLPIRIREIIGGDGTRQRTLHVFCPREEASIALEGCAKCAFRCPPASVALAPAVGCGGDSETEAPSLTAHPALVVGPDALAARVSAGAASARVVVCVHRDASLGVVHDAVGPEHLWIGFPVVDVTGVLLGSVPGTVVASAAQDRGAAILPAFEVMSSITAVRESAHLDDAIGIMTSHHLRHVPIVDAQQRVTGILSDLDVLRWVARGAPRRWQ